MEKALVLAHKPAMKKPDQSASLTREIPELSPEKVALFSGIESGKSFAAEAVYAAFSLPNRMHTILQE